MTYEIGKLNRETLLGPVAAAEDALASDADDADAANAKKWAEIRIQVATGA